MADIKTRDVVKHTVKTIDKAAIASERMKHAYVSVKNKAETSTHANEESIEEYSSNKLESMASTAQENVRRFNRAGRTATRNTNDNYHKIKDGVQRFKAERVEQGIRQQTVNRHGKGRIKALEHPQKTVKETAKSSGKRTVKSTAKGVTKTASKSVKTAEKTAKTTIKTTKQTAKVAQKTAQATAKATQKAAQAARVTAKATITAAKVAIKATIAAVKAIIAATKALVSAIVAGGWVAVFVIIVICLVAMIVCSFFGIFFSGEDSGTGMTMQTVVQEINTEYESKINEEKSSVSYDVLEMSGSRAVWKEVLAVYAVKVNTDPDDPQEVATMDNGKKRILKDIFWEMNSISSRTETKSETVIKETDDGNGNIVQTETTVTRTYLYITVSHKTADEMASHYRFSRKQKEYLTELLDEENNSLWATALYGIKASDDQIVTVALSQVGNVGGKPYWSWYGFQSHVEWCACFVSWCANECGYIDAGVIPKFSLCTDGEDWFKNRGQWADSSHEPLPGTIIFFDWEGDGGTDHVGIVQKCKNGIVYTVEGNMGDACTTRQYPVNDSQIYGYGIPAY